MDRQSVRPFEGRERPVDRRRKQVTSPIRRRDLVLGQQAIVLIQTHGMHRRHRIHTRPIRAPPRRSAESNESNHQSHPMPTIHRRDLVLGQQAIVWIQTHGMRRRQRIRTRPLRAPPHLHLSLTLQRQGSDRDVRRRVLVISNTRALGIVNDRRRDRHRRTCAHEVHDPRQAPCCGSVSSRLQASYVSSGR